MKLNPEISEKLIEILGEERINAVYELMRSKPVSFSTLRFMLRRKKILDDISRGKSIKEIINEYRLSKMTVYRLLKTNGNKKNTESNT